MLHYRHSHRERGQGLVEYALILVLVAVVVIAILSALGPQIGNIFSKVIAGLNRSPSAEPCTVTTNTGLTFTVPANILSKSVLSSPPLSWAGTGTDRLRNSTMAGSPPPTLARFNAKTWSTTNVTKAVGNCSPFPNK
jgi:pilus assembly protein Flp/PilA